MDQSLNNLSLADISISEDGTNLTSRTPPPPGFSGSSNSEREKSTSFDNLAMALGTGLAESMDNSTSDSLAQQQQQQGLQQQRIPTPSNVDNYTRQSRHLASRLVGGGNNGSTGRVNEIGGFDYRNPSKTGHLLIPPSNNIFLEKLKAERDGAGGGDLGEQQGLQGGDNFLPSLNSGMTRLQHQQDTDALTAAKNYLFQSNKLNNNTTNLHQSGLNTGQQFLTQELLKHQMWQQNKSTGDYKANSQLGGVTVVEPPSRNSPAPRTVAVNNTGLVNIGNGGMIGTGNQRGSNFLNEQQSFDLGNGSNFVRGRLSAPPPSIEGRASAPPVNSQQRMNLNSGLGCPNNATLRASLEMRVAALHQEIGAYGNTTAAKNLNNAPINLKTIPAGNIIVLAPPAPPTSQVIIKAPSREVTPLDRNSPRPQTQMSTFGNPTQNQVAQISVEQVERERVAVEELAPYLHEPHEDQRYNTSLISNANSRGVAIIYASRLVVADVRSTCEAFGTLETFRSDFAESKGVYFVTFYDLRSARLALVELPNALNQMVSKSGSEQIQVKYCVPLNSSSATDESMLLLANIPDTILEQDVKQSMSSFGEIRNVHYQANLSDDDCNTLTYLVEFYDIQDARQALMELEHSTPWGSNILVKVGPRNPTKRKQGKELLVLMSSWRQMQKVDGESNILSPSPFPKHSDNVNTHSVDDKNDGSASAQSNYQHQRQDFQQDFSSQLVIGPDGNYMYVLVPNQQHVPSLNPYSYPNQMVIDPHQHQQFIYSNPQYVQNHQQLHMDQQYQMQYSNSMRPQASSYAIHMQENQNPPAQFVRMMSDMNTWNSGSISSESGQSPGNQRTQTLNFQKIMQDSKSTTSPESGSSSGNRARDDENASLTLDIEAVRSSKDTRSSLMVRNIPNKYTQKMLLAEFADAGHGSDKMDFFYLPIDFKNKCNRGYAFVNFVDFKDIIPFCDEYNGTSWSKFNSDKICDISYARIQGKTAMLKRFENSALMEKDNEYRPMVFVSHGEKKGQLEAMSPNMNLR